MSSVASANVGANSGTTSTATQYLTYSRQDIINMLMGYGLTQTQAIELASVVPQESGGIANALNNTPATGDYSLGLFQINMYPWNTSTGTGGTNYTTVSKLSGGLTGTALENWLMVPQNNALAAATLYKEGGMSPWEADVSGIAKDIANTGWSVVYNPTAAPTTQGTYTDATTPNAVPGALAGTDFSIANLWSFLFGGGLTADVNKGLKYLIGGILAILGLIILLMQIQSVNDTIHDIVTTAKEGG
jgi:hypothetical protein